MKKHKRKVLLGIFLLMTALSLHATDRYAPLHPYTLLASHALHSLLPSSGGLVSLMQAPNLDAWLQRNYGWTEVIRVELPKQRHSMIRATLYQRPLQEDGRPGSSGWDWNRLLQPQTGPYVVMLIGMLLLALAARGND